MQYLPEGSRIHTIENQHALSSIAAMERAMAAGTILEAKAILCDSNHNLIVQLPCMRGIIPRDEGAMGIAEGTTRDIALIARAGKPVCFRILRMETDENGNPTSGTGSMLGAVSLPVPAGGYYTGSCHSSGAIRRLCGYRLRYSVSHPH